MFRAIITIMGDVQGVGFRWSAREITEKLGLVLSRAENRPDGSVLFAVEGQRDTVEKFIAWARQGPNLAKVERVKIDYL